MKTEEIRYALDNKGLVKSMKGYSGKNTTRDLATFYGLSASTISRLENGKALDMDSFCKICARGNFKPGDYFLKQVWVMKSES